MRWALRQGHSANFNPRSPHGERRHTEKGGAIILVISIHAPRTGSDDAEVFAKRVIKHFNPRSPHGERRRVVYNVYKRTDFNPRSPHGERPGASRVRARGSDFNPRSPHGERLTWLSHYMLRPQISIHAPRTGSDWRASHRRKRYSHFNPRSPHGERPSYHFSRFTSKIFQSTLPARGATCPRCRWGRPFHFNPRSPHGERRKAAANRHVAGYFNPRSPHGERRRLRAHCQRHSHFNPRSPHGERRIQAQRGLRQGRFQSTLPARGATSAG